MKFSDIDPLLVEIVLIDLDHEMLMDFHPPKSTITDHLRDCFGFLC